jgi:hypothetical protein
MTQRVLGPGGSPRRRRLWHVFVVLALAGIAGVLVFAVGAGANLAGSNFEGNDGNLVHGTGNTDWDNAPNRAVGTDLPTGTTDNSFGQGDKEDDPNVHVGDGSIPNSKADLAQFYVGSEQRANNHVYLYLGWTRANDGGTTNFDFEINQKAQPDLTQLGATSLVRTSGDLLVNYLFQGTGTPTVAIRTWNGSAWSAPIDASAFSEAAINSSGPVSNPLPQAINPTPTNRFGEAAIDLTAGGIIPPGVCEAFGSAFVKTRASTSFTSEIKDFIAPIPVNINTCATIVVKKVTVPSPDATNTSFSFTSNFNGNFSLKNGEQSTKTGLNPGTSYSVSETTPANWTLTSFTCSDGSLPSAINLGPGETVTCTATNTLQLGAIKVTKTTKVPGKTGPQPQAGVKFTVEGVDKTTGADGTACFDGLSLGSHNVTETVPTGYKADGANPKSVDVDNAASCSDATYVGETVGFTNSPLTSVTISVDSKAVGGTDTNVNCDDNSLDFDTPNTPDPNAGDGSKTSDDVAGSKTIICTITIDP